MNKSSVLVGLLDRNMMTRNQGKLTLLYLHRTEHYFSLYVICLSNYHHGVYDTCTRGVLDPLEEVVG